MRKLFNRICNKEIDFTIGADWVEVVTKDSEGVNFDTETEMFILDIKLLASANSLSLQDDTYCPEDGLVLKWKGPKKNMLRFLVDLNHNYYNRRLGFNEIFTLCKLALR